MGTYIVLMLLSSIIILSLLSYVIAEHIHSFDASILIFTTIFCSLSLLIYGKIFDVKNDTFYRPLKETLHIEYKNGVPTDTTYTYE